MTNTKLPRLNAEEKDREKLRRRFPTQHARIAADKAVDALPATVSMQEHLDVWFQAYGKAGGRPGAGARDD